MPGASFSSARRYASDVAAVASVAFHPSTQKTRGEYEDAMRAEVPGLVCKCTEAYTPAASRAGGSGSADGAPPAVNNLPELPLAVGDLVLVLRQADPPASKKKRSGPSHRAALAAAAEPVLYIPHDKVCRRLTS